MPFLPTCWEIGSRLHEWKATETLDFQQYLTPGAVTLVHGSLTIDKEHRLDTDPRTGMMNRRIWGYICDINAPTNI